MPSKKEFLLAKTKHFGRHAVQKRASVAIWGWAWRARGWLRALQGPQPGPLPLPLPLMCEQLPPSQLRALWVQGPRSGPPMPQGLAKARPFGKAALMPRLRLGKGNASPAARLTLGLACSSAFCGPCPHRRPSDSHSVGEPRTPAPPRWRRAACLSECRRPDKMTQGLA